MESLARTLTGERDLFKAVSRAVRSEHVPAPLGELIKKLYAYRGDEPGVAHGDEETPDVDQQDAQFVLNLAAAIGIYLRGGLWAARSASAAGTSCARRAAPLPRG